MKIKLLNHTTDPIRAMAYAARVSHRSEGKTMADAIQLMKNIIKWGHFSVLEHASATFEISGISRACSHQIVRHRHLSIVQESQRYVEVGESSFITPESFSLSERELYKEYIKKMYECYKVVLKRVPKEDARFILPNATKTRMVATGNFRTWREFLHKRLTKASQWEIRKVAEEIKNELLSVTDEFLWEEI